MRMINLPAFGALLAGQGGYFAGIFRGRDAQGNATEDYGLIVANAPDIESIEWGKYNQEVKAESRFDGQANTAGMADAGSELAIQIQALEIDGHKDFYLPAHAELQTLAASVPELFSTENWYWSSTQSSRNIAWVQDFEHGTSDNNDKDYECRARAVRRVPLQTFSS